MGCLHGKCCGSYPESSDANSDEFRDVGPCGVQGKHILTERSMESVPVPSHNFRLDYSLLTQRGYYPYSPDKENQDSYCIRTQLQGNPNIHFFGVFDGHGLFGTQCSNFVKDRLVEKLDNDPTLANDPAKAYYSAFQITNQELYDSKIDDSKSGTTAITVLVVGNMIFVANVGDSRAVIAAKVGNRVLAEDLSSDQTPFRRDEYERVKLCGARVLNIDQVEGLKDPNIQTWGDEKTQGNDPPRLWVQNGMYPGTAFTRSIGDSEAEKIGVVADPEVLVVQLTPDYIFFVVASDGVFEFLSSQAVVNMVASYSDPRDACAAIAGESYKLWLEHGNRTDDITIIIVHIRDFSYAGANTRDKKSRLIIRCEYTDTDGSHHTLSIARNAAIVVPSPPQALQLDGGSPAHNQRRSTAKDAFRRFHHLLNRLKVITPDLRRTLIGRAHLTMCGSCYCLMSCYKSVYGEVFA